MAMMSLVEKVEVAEAIDALAEAVGALDVAVISGAEAARLTELFARGERLCAAGQALAARRAADCGEWSRRGARSPEAWLAAVSGTPLGPARTALDVADRMETQPELDEAVKAGHLSPAQAAEIAEAARVDPASCPRLIERARTDSYRTLKDACQATRLAAASPAEDRARAAALHESRYCRTWTDRDGAGRLDARLAPERLAAVLACLKPFQDRIFDAARQAGQRERTECYTADALVAMAQAAHPGRADGADGVGDHGGAGDASGRPPAMVIALVDHAALVRGHTQGGETCELDGIGPVPVATVRDMMNDAFLAAVVTDGIDIRSVAHLGRRVTARQRTSLIARDRCCVIPGCGVTEGLEIDHVKGWEVTHTTTVDDLARECHHHHYLKTYKGWTLTGTPGNWEWHPPPDVAAPGPFDDDGLDLPPP